MASFNNVIILICSEFALFPMGGAIERPTEGDFATEYTLSIAPPIGNNANSLQI